MVDAPSSRRARGTGRPPGRARERSARRRRPAQRSRRRQSPGAAGRNPSRRSPRWPPVHRRRARHRQDRVRSCILQCFGADCVRGRRAQEPVSAPAVPRREYRPIPSRILPATIAARCAAAQAGRGPEGGRNRGRGRAGQGDPMRCVMKCHEMSCFVMVPYAQGSCPVAGPGMSAAVLHRAPGQSPRFVCRSVFGMGLSFCTRFVPFFPPPGSPERRVPFSRVTHGARAPAFAPARCARLIAHARASLAQGALLPSVPLGFFRAGARRETKWPADAASSCLILPRIYRGSNRFGNSFLLYEQAAAGQKRRMKLSGLRAPLQSIRSVPSR